ncbi:MAG: hypothetical protein IPL61_07285 [Myxococcales bacterium]|nr:hypothetical protein [Myxococcales bacterium]
MSQPNRWARGAACALVLALAAQPALADRKKKKARAPRASIADCTSFEQVDRVDESVDLVIANTCEVAVACSVSWTVTCAPGTKRAHRHQHGSAFALATTQSQAANASAAVCGNDGWVIDDVLWSCQPEPPAAAPTNP